MSSLPESADATELARVKRRLERARTAQQEMEAISEQSLRELYLREQELRLLQDVATAANLSQSTRDVFQYVLTRICDFMSWPVGHALLAEDQKGSPHLKSMALWHARDFEKIKAFRGATEARGFLPDEGLPGRVFRSTQPIWLIDVVNDDSFLRRTSAKQDGIQSACAFPILVGEEVVAVLEFFTTRQLEPDASVLKLMPQVATHLGRTIERQRAEDRLIHDASHDPLTGLPNRMLFLDRLNQAISHGRRKPQRQFAVLFVDLDRFKIVNDSLGHLAGDHLIVEVARRLRSALRSEDCIARPESETATGASTLARLGGDEFTILLEDISDTRDAVRVANRVQDVLRAPFAIDGQDIFTSASIGIASSASGYDTADAILRDADLAMYRAKVLGKSRCELFDQEMHAAAMNRLALETDLRRALQNEEFLLHYQPIISLQTETLVGFEALVRWQKPGNDLIYPDDFIDVTEETGLIVFLGLWVLREACRTMRNLHEQFPREDPLSISVNLSPRQFAQPDLVEQVRTIVAETGIDPHCLRLEITESVTIEDTARVSKILTELKKLGVRLSIDDFGTGYSSLSYLHSLPLDTLKIDQSFVAAMSQSAESLQIVQTIIDLARNLGMDVVAEGTELAGQVGQLQALGCGFGQGYYFSKPVDLATATQLLGRSDWSVHSDG